MSNTKSFAQGDGKAYNGISIHLFNGDLLYKSRGGGQRTEACATLGFGIEYELQSRNKVAFSLFSDYRGYKYATSTSTQVGSYGRTFETNLICIGVMLNRVLVRLYSEKIKLSSNLSIGFNIPLRFEGTTKGSFFGMGSSNSITNPYTEIFPFRIAVGLKLKLPGLNFDKFNASPQIFTTIDSSTISLGKPSYIINYFTGIGFVFFRN